MMKKQRGYINIDGAIPIFWFGVISIALLVLTSPFIAYYQYSSYQEERQLLDECERNLPREQSCVIVKTAKARGEQ